MQRAPRTPVVGRALLALATSVLLAMAGPLLPAGAAQAAAPGAVLQVWRPSAPATTAAGRHHHRLASTLSARSARHAPGIVHSGKAPSTDSVLPHLTATPPAAVSLHTGAPREGPGAAAPPAPIAVTAPATSSRAPPTGL